MGADCISHHLIMTRLLVFLGLCAAVASAQYYEPLVHRTHYSDYVYQPAPYYPRQHYSYDPYYPRQEYSYYPRQEYSYYPRQEYSYYPHQQYSYHPQPSVYYQPSYPRQGYRYAVYQ